MHDLYLAHIINECAEGIDTCAQICTDTVTSYTCSCNSGYSLGSDQRSCYGELINMNVSYLIIFFCPLDIPECSLGTDNCQQLCVETVGSYACACNSGYRLASDRRTCNGQ